MYVYDGVRSTEWSHNTAYLFFLYLQLCFDFFLFFFFVSLLLPFVINRTALRKKKKKKGESSEKVARKIIREGIKEIEISRRSRE